MNGDAQHRVSPATPPRPMGRAIVISFIVHATIIVMMIVGLPRLMPPEPLPPTPMAVELVTAADLAQTTAPPVKSPPKPEPKDEPAAAKKPPKPKANPIQEPPTPLPTDQKKPDPKPDVKDETPEPDGIKPPPKVEKKPDKKPPKKDPPKENTEFSSLLKNLTKDEPVPETTIDDLTKQLTSAPPPAPDAPQGATITASDMDALRAQLAGCWNVFAGASEAQDLIVRIRIQVNPDKTLQQATIVDTDRYQNDDRFRAAAESALRALRDPRCSPLNLPDGKYSLWQDMIIRFNPQEMF